MKYYQKSLPVKEDEYQDLIQIKIELEQTLKKPISIRNLIRAIIKFAKEKKNSEDFLKVVKDVLGMKEVASTQKEEKKDLFLNIKSKIFKK
ncbi:MAG: hypothetical protein QXW01_00985 [Candidatus Aenigmatarchaeota archaeon]